MKLFSAHNALLSIAALVLAAAPRNTAAQNWAAQQPPYGRPDATIDLRTNEGVELVKGQWRYSDAKIIEVDSRGPGADLKPSGAPVKTYDYTPHAGVAGFDDSKWETIASAKPRRSALGRQSLLQLVPHPRHHPGKGSSLIDRRHDGGV